MNVHHCFMSTHNKQQSETVTVIGLGDMGTALASAFIAEGHRTTVWNRTLSKADVLVQRGAHKAQTVHEAISASNLIVVCISDYAAVMSTLDAVEDFEARTLLNVTTGSTTEARAMSAWTEQRNGVYIDGAILAMTNDVGADRSGAIFCSGSKAVWDRHEATLSALGSGVEYLGADPGLTGLYDVAAQGVTWSALNAFLHATALFEAAGQDPKTVLPLLEKTLHNVAGWLAAFADQIETGTYPPDGDIHTQLRAINNFANDSAAAGINSELPRLIQKFAEQAVADGDGANGYPAIINQFRKASTS